MQSQQPPQNHMQTDAYDRDVFLRVWERVMPEEGASCPIAVQRSEREDQNHAGDDFPEREDVPCLGSAARSEEGRLQEWIGVELGRWQTYRTLSRRSCQGARTLAGMAVNCRRRAKRLSAALFLISGVRFWPQEQTGVPTLRSWYGTLRELFLAEQAAACAYRAAAEECRDACLQALYLDLADECGEHAGFIRTLVENM